MEKLRVVLVVSVFALLVAACGGGGSSSSNETPSPSVTVSLSELTATIEISTTHQFSATVENAEDTSVTWKVNNVTGGNSTVGTISESGVYTAPDRVPSPITVTVSAAAHADATKTASATVTIMSNVTIAVSPKEAVTLPAGETYQFTAAIEHAKDTAARWKVNEVAGGSATLGTISAGLYTAPALPPAGGSVTITAIALADTSKTDAVTVTVQFSNASLSGPYIVSFSGHEQGVPFYAIGRFVADGQGNILNGIQDYQQNGIASPRTFTGTYDVQPQRAGRVAVTLYVVGNEGTGTANFRFELTNAGEGPMLSFNNFMAGSGQIYKQEAVTFSNASMSGSYVFQLIASTLSGTAAMAGVFTCDGAGNIISGMEDVNDGEDLAIKVPMNGGYSVDANGRAILTISGSSGTDSFTTHVATYLISGDRAVFMNIDDQDTSGVGVAEKQQIASFNNASLSGDYVYFAMAEPTTHAAYSLGMFTANGGGAISAGVEDNNSRGEVTRNSPFTGTYSIPVTDHGRGTVTITTSEGPSGGAIFYLVSKKKAFMVGTETSSPDGGQIVAQQGAPFSTGSLQGAFVHTLRGFSYGLEVGLLGSLNLDGSGTLSGSQAVNVAGILASNVALTGTYSVGANGRGEATITGGAESSYALYVVDSSHALLLETDPDATTFGSLVSQF
ncbi:MAG TPA: hypothetical protein VMW54_09850 [Terriglobia bacterium]|nr:hypothetical protein [Terriglobia bacterium]